MIWSIDKLRWCASTGRKVRKLISVIQEAVVKGCIDAQD